MLVGLGVDRMNEVEHIGVLARKVEEWLIKGVRGRSSSIGEEDDEKEFYVDISLGNTSEARISIGATQRIFRSWYRRYVMESGRS